MRNVRGRVTVSHVRLATSGSVSRGDTRPWVFRGWAFTHNGGVDRGPILEALKQRYRKEMEGNTNSEALFRLVEQEIEGTGNRWRVLGRQLSGLLRLGRGSPPSTSS